MMCKARIVFVLYVICSFRLVFASVDDNEVHDDPLSGILGSFVNVVNNYQTSNDKNSNILEGLGSLVNNVDPSLIGNVLGLMGNDATKETLSSNNANLLSSVVELMRLSGINLENIINYLPTLISTFNSFTGPEAVQREQSHKDHEKLLPPFIEYLHVIWDHFTNSQLYRQFEQNYDFQGYVNLIRNENGEIDYEKLLVFLENQSYRKYWLEAIAEKISVFVNYVGDRDLQNQILQSLTFMVNNVLKSQQYPSSVYLDLNNKVDSISNLLNYFLNRNFNYNVNTKAYVEPSLEFLENLMASGRQKGYFFASSDFSKKLIEVLNNEIIEPIIRVYRANKFINERPSCTLYVLCTINQPDLNDRGHLPGVKLMLTKASSLGASWFISRNSNFSFLTLYNVIISDHHCKIKYREECAEFHHREEQYSNKFTHNEL